VTQIEPNAPLLWPALDLGGTSIRVLLIADGGEDRPRPMVRVELPTPRGLTALLQALGEALERASRTAAETGHRVAPALAIGTPGRLEPGPNNRRRIAPRSATNLEAFPGEMDGVDLGAEIADALDLPRSRVFWDNDAVVQGRWLIGELLRDADSTAILLEHSVVCINPGTGLGGCVAEVDVQGGIEVFTDSHISELLLHPLELVGELDALQVAVRSTADASTIQITARLGKEEHGLLLNSPVGKQAEDFLSGTGLSLIAGGLERCAGPLIESGSCLGVPADAVDGELLSGLLEADAETVAHRAAMFMGSLGGHALARLLSILRDGTAKKSASFPAWPETELDRLRGVSRFVLGGGITRTPLGMRMIAEARGLLSGWSELRIFEMDHIADEAGALGAFSLIPEDLRRELEADASSG
jgi:hypothetical protein